MTIWTILDWILYGLIRYVLYLIPLVKAPRVYRSMPSEWWRYNWYSDWLHLDDDGGYPDERWCRCWLEMAFGELQRLATDKARPYVDQAKAALLKVIGYVRSGYSSLGDWVNHLQMLVGESVPFFAVNLTGAAAWLYYRLPASIRQGWRGWDATWEWIKETVRAWARSRYDEAKFWASRAWDWMLHTGAILRRWQERVEVWIDHVRGNSYGWMTSLLGPAWFWLLGFWSDARAIVLGWLGPDWPKLVTFSRDCISFYYNLWSAGWRVLGDFVADPRGFILDRLESALMDRW